MYALLGIRSVLRLYGAIAALWAALLALASLLLAAPSGAAEWATLLGRSVGLAGLLAAGTLALLGRRKLLWPMLRVRTRLIGQAPFPDINGRWRGKVTHNWPLIERVHQAARGDTSPFIPEKGQVAWGETPVEATITADLFRLGMRMTSSLMTSEVLAVWPLPAERPGRPKLAYLFVAEVHQTKAERSDDRVFDGAGIVEVIEPDRPGERLRLEGRYWTNRAWRNAMSTAGKVHLVHVPDEPGQRPGGSTTPTDDPSRRDRTG